jgi:hypothetical protein
LVGKHRSSFQRINQGFISKASSPFRGSLGPRALLWNYILVSIFIMCCIESGLVEGLLGGPGDHDNLSLLHSDCYKFWGPSWRRTSILNDWKGLSHMLCELRFNYCIWRLLGDYPRRLRVLSDPEHSLLNSNLFDRR